MSNILLKKDFADGDVLYGKDLNGNNATTEAGVNDNYKLIKQLSDNKTDITQFNQKLEEVNQAILDRTTYEYVNGELAKKVNAVEGKQLSTNDFSNAEKAKLASLENYDDSAIRELLNQKADSSSVPVKVSQLINDANYTTKTYVDDKISNIQLFRAEVVDVLPETGESNVLYLVPRASRAVENICDEYLWVNNKWESIGTTSVDLQNFYTKTESDKRYLQYFDIYNVDENLGNAKAIKVNSDLLSIVLQGEIATIQSTIKKSELMTKEEYIDNSTNAVKSALKLSGVDTSVPFSYYGKNRDGAVGFFEIPSIKEPYTLPPATASTLGGIKVGNGLSIAQDGTLSSESGSSYVLPIASEVILGGVKVGEALKISENGVLSLDSTYLSKSLEGVIKAYISNDISKGTLDELETVNKDSLVAAINEINTSSGKGLGTEQGTSSKAIVLSTLSTGSYILTGQYKITNSSEVIDLGTNSLVVTVQTSLYSKGITRDTSGLSKYISILNHREIPQNSYKTYIVSTIDDSIIDEFTLNLDNGMPMELPIGAALMWFTAIIPNGFVEYNGQELSRTAYKELFDAIGTTYGEGDGSTTFNVPDMRGLVPIGVGAHTDKNNKDKLIELGKEYGEYEHKQTLEELVEHTHNLPMYTGGAGGFQNASGTAPDTVINRTTSATGNGQPFNVIQPSFGVRFIGKAFTVSKKPVASEVVQDLENDSVNDVLSVSGLKKLISDLKNEIRNEDYPIGRGFIDFTDTDYSNYLGFTWEKTLIGMTPIGAGSHTDKIGQNMVFELGKEYGEYQHKLTIDELASHPHAFQGGNALFNQPDQGVKGLAGGNLWIDGVGTIPQTSKAGGDIPHNNIQPSYAVNYWKRVA